MKKTILLLIPVILSGCQDRQDDRIQSARFFEEVRTTNTPGSSLRLAQSMREAGNYNMSIQLYEQAIQMDPSNLNAHIGLSQCLRSIGRNDAALVALKSVPVDSQSAIWYKELGSVYSASQKPRQCIEAYRKAHDLEPRDVGTINGIAVCNDLLGQHNEAQKWYNEAIALAPANDNLKSNLALSLSLASKTNQAIEILTPIVDGNYATPRDRQNLAMAYGLSGDMSKAAQIFSQDLSEEEVRKNLAFIHKLAQSQHLTPTQTISGTPAQNSFETNLATEDKAPSTQNEKPAEALMSQDSISKDSHVIVNPLPLSDTHAASNQSEPLSEIKSVDKKDDKHATYSTSQPSGHEVAPKPAPEDMAHVRTPIRHASGKTTAANKPPTTKAKQVAKKPSVTKAKNTTKKPAPKLQKKQAK